MTSNVEDPAKSTPPEKKQLQIGGQAVIEGVVMRGPEKWALAVRKPGGEIFLEVNESKSYAQRHPRLNYFPFRGIMALSDSLVISVKALNTSGNVALEELEKEEEKKKAVETGKDPEKAVEEKPPAEISKWLITISMVFALTLFLGLFIVLPTVVAKPLDKAIDNTVLFNLVEGTIRISIFLAYLLLISLMPDIRRVFQYHGAEHKTVHAYEAGKPLTVDTVSNYSTAHPRCGTAFLLIVMVLSVLIFSLFGRPALWLRIIERLAVIPLIAAFSYELIKLTDKHMDSRLVRWLVAPGLLLQRLTTREPDDEQIEVAIKALQTALED